MSPKNLLMILFVVGMTAMNLLWLRQTDTAPPQQAQPTAQNALFPTSEQADQSENKRLMELVQHLEDQVKALTKENADLVQKLGSLGMKEAMSSQPSPAPATPATSQAPGDDYIAVATELQALRGMEVTPVPVITATEAEVQAVILRWLRSIHNTDHGRSEGLALWTLGLTETAVDTLEVRAALLARVLTGFYDDEKQVILTIPPHNEPGGTLIATEPALGIAYSLLFKEHRAQLFGPDYAKLSSDERLARLCLLGGDAALCRFLFSLSEPGQGDPNALPTDDPDHPLNQIVAPDFLRQSTLWPQSVGFEFVQTLHSIGEWKKVNEAYTSPPSNSSEVMDTELYTGQTRLPAQSPPMPSTTETPEWDDHLGRQVLVYYLQRAMEYSEAQAAAATWRGDAFQTFSSSSSVRGTALWRVMTSSPEDASRLAAAFKMAVISLNGLDEAQQLPAAAPEGRFLDVFVNGQIVTFISAPSQETHRSWAEKTQQLR